MQQRIAWEDLPEDTRTAIQAQRTRAWHTAPASALDTFTLASARLWQEIADNDPHPWKQHMARAAREWADARMTPVGT